jgi:hypothetical protein
MSVDQMSVDQLFAGKMLFVQETKKQIKKPSGLILSDQIKILPLDVGILLPNFVTRWHCGLKLCFSTFV